MKRRLFFTTMIFWLAIGIAACSTLGSGEEVIVSQAELDAFNAKIANVVVDEASFPLTIEHKFGRTEITELPERIVTVGYSEHDFVLSLGVKPLGVRQWYGGYQYETWPWARAALGDAQPETIGGVRNINFEKIASLEPDLIMGVTSGMTQEEYESLSRLAPTVAQPGEYVDFGTPWPEVTRIHGRALGRSDYAEQLIAEIEASFAEVREANPGFDGASLAVAFNYNGSPGIYASTDTRPRLLSELGFVTPEEYDEMAGDSFFASFDEERLADVLDVDMLIWIASNDREIRQIQRQALRGSLDAAQEGRELFLGKLLGGAFSFSSPLSLPYLLDELVPMLEVAADGDPETAVPEP
ncbi:MAG: iron-siderophore ABC transporter substrate-binding protein [Chloroflexota bacterium]